MTPAIITENLSKQYTLRGAGQQPTLLGALRNTLRRVPPKTFWAIKDLNIRVPKGAAVGFVGPNGSGKSSTLGLIAGTITPTNGSVQVEGMISCLLELGAGFHPDLTGRENIYLNAALMGIPRTEVDKRQDAIIDFSGLGEFIDMPVKNYSSGMYVRLGFSIATEVDPDVLLVDEVLAVGDHQFSLKCLARMQEFKQRGKTIVLVSHALETVEGFCDEIHYLRTGELQASGPPHEILENYVQEIGMGPGLAIDEHGTRDVTVERLELLNRDHAPKTTFTCGEAMTIRVHYNAAKRIEQPIFGFSVKNEFGVFIYGSNTQIHKVDIPHVEGEGHIDIVLDPLTLRRGRYRLSLAVHSQDHATQYHRIEDQYPFQVKNRDDSEGPFDLRPVFK